MSADAATQGRRPHGSRRVPSGIDPLDTRLGGLNPGGLYLLSGGDVEVRHYLSLAYLQAGVIAGDRATLVTQAPRDHLVRRLRQWDLDELREAWNDGRLRISGYRGGYESRVRNAGDPETVFEELERRIYPDADRVALVPGRPMWEGALGPLMTEAFVEWTLRTPATVWATSQRSVEESADDERLHHAATGVFQLTRDPRGRTALRVRKTADADLEPTTLALDGSLGRTGGRGGRPAPLRTLLMTPSEDRTSSSFSTLRGWLREIAETREVTDPMELLDALQERTNVDLVVVLAAQGDLESSVRACHLARSVGSAPVVAVVEDRVRAADRAHLIRAGADECLSGPVNLGELASRLDRLLPGADRFEGAVGDGAADGADGGDGGDGGDGRPDAGVLTEEDFRSHVRRGLSREPPEVFTVVRIPGEALPEEAGERLGRIVRREDGDVVGPVGDGMAVYLAGTSPDEALGFLSRLASTYGDIDGETELLGSVRDAGTLRRLAGDG